MTENSDASTARSMVKVVYFDEQSASDYLDINAGGSAATTSEDVRKRTADTHAQVNSKVAAKLSWLPFVGVSGEAGAGFEYSNVGQSILSKTLSNTILTDYLEEIVGDDRIQRLEGYTLRAAEGSMTAAKMYTPYMTIMKVEDVPIDFARMDEALERAKGYYELVATSADAPTERRVLRFNIRAFRNNYGLSDLGRMRLVFHAILVGETTDSALTMDGEISTGERSEPPKQLPKPGDLLDGVVVEAKSSAIKLDVYDVVLAGVEHG